MSEKDLKKKKSHPNCELWLITMQNSVFISMAKMNSLSEHNSYIHTAEAKQKINATDIFPFFFPPANPAAWTNREAEPVAVMPTVQIVAAATPTASGLTDRVDLLQTKHRYSVYYWYTSRVGKG